MGYCGCSRLVYTTRICGVVPHSLFLNTTMKKPIVALVALAILGVGQLTKADEVAEITLTADKLTFAFDKKEFTVKAGQKVKLTLVNPADSQNQQPHNLVMSKKGSLAQMIGIANDPANFSNPEFLKDPIPKTDLIVRHTKLLKPGESETLEFTAPEEAGDYPYLCTFVGHAAIMNGVMKVE